MINVITDPDNLNVSTRRTAIPLFAEDWRWLQTHQIIYNSIFRIWHSVFYKRYDDSSWAYTARAVQPFLPPRRDFYRCQVLWHQEEMPQGPRYRNYSSY